MFESRKLMLVAAMLGGAVFVSGCKQTSPVQTAPAAAPGTPAVAGGAVAGGAIAVRNPDGSITNPDGSLTYPAGSSAALRERQPNGPPPAPGAGLVVASNGPRTNEVRRDYPAAAGPGGTYAAPYRGTGATPAAGTYPASRPDAVAPAPVLAAVMAPAGTAVVMRLNGGLAASRNEVGDRFSGVLEQAVVSHGQTVFERGTPVSGEVVAAKGKGRFKGAGDLGIELTAIGRQHVSSSEYEKIAKGRGKRTAGFIGGGAGLGALIGGLAGGGKGALIGGLAGGGAGTAAGAYTGSRDVVIPAESVITFRLTRAVER